VKDDHALQRNYTEGVVKCAELKKKKTKPATKRGPSISRER